MVIEFVVTAATIPKSAIIPVGQGRKIKPTIVAVKIANKCHPSGLIASCMRQEPNHKSYQYRQLRRV